MNRFTLLKILTVATSLWFADAQAVLTVKITQGADRALPIAVVPFRVTGTMPADIAEIVAADLQRSGRFAPMAVQDMISKPSEFSEVKFDDWRKLSMENLVIGKVTPTPDGNYSIEFRLVGVYKATQLIGFQMNATAGTLRLAAHQISDIIYEKLTGEKGAFATRIAYITVRGNLPGKKIYTLQLADADGYNPQTLLESPQPILSPDWAPDGRRIAYVSFEGGNSAIYVQDVQTGQRQLVASGQGINSSPAWSPDGTRLAMTRSKDGNAEIYVLYLDSGDPNHYWTAPNFDLGFV